jgi:hypothetical protein
LTTLGHDRGQTFGCPPQCDQFEASQAASLGDFSIRAVRCFDLLDEHTLIAWARTRSVLFVGLSIIIGIMVRRHLKAAHP